jgi:hypothetical protein
VTTEVVDDDRLLFIASLDTVKIYSSLSFDFAARTVTQSPATKHRVRACFRFFLALLLDSPLHFLPAVLSDSSSTTSDLCKHVAASVGHNDCRLNGTTCHIEAHFAPNAESLSPPL